MSTLLRRIYTNRILIFGDTLVILLITISGFATHGEIGNMGRMLTTIIPLFAAWFLISPFFGLFNEKIIYQPNQLWRVILAMFGVIPLAAWLRGLWLNTPILPLFVLVLGGVSSFCMFLWRTLYLVVKIRAGQSHG